MTITLDVNPRLVARLTQVQQTGLYGHSLAEAIERLVSERIQTLIRDELIDLEYNSTSWEPETKPGRV